MCGGGSGIIGNARQLMHLAASSGQRSGTSDVTKAAFDGVDRQLAEKAKTEQANKDVETQALQNSQIKAAEEEQARRAFSRTLISGNAQEDDEYSIKKPRARRATLIASDA